VNVLIKNTDKTDFGPVLQWLPYRRQMLQNSVSSQILQR